MNQYQLEVALFDQKLRQHVRALTFIGAAILAMTVLWSTDVALIGWFKGIHQRFASVPQKPAQVAQTPTPVSLPGDLPLASREVLPQTLPGTDSSLSKVPLALVLVRTAPGRNIGEGTAAIGVARDNPQTYMAGALLTNGARLREVHNDHVVLERNGSSVRLYLDAKKNSNSDLAMVGGPQKATPAVATTSEPIVDYLRPNPVYDGQALRGYEVYPGRNVGAFSQLGLQGGDVITSLNNAPFVDPEEAIDRFRQLMSGAAMAATIERKGESKTVTLDGSIIVADQARASNAMTPPVSMLP